MSSPRGATARRKVLLTRLAAAGRAMSDAAVMFHTVVAEQLGLGPSDWKMLGLLEGGGPMTAGELSARSGLAPASVTGILDRLERGRWVRRRRDPADGRRVVVVLNQTVLADRMRDFFGGLVRRLDDLYARYDDRELERWLEFMTEVARRQKEATAEMTGTLPVQESRRSGRPLNRRRLHRVRPG